MDPLAANAHGVRVRLGPSVRMGSGHLAPCRGPPRRRYFRAPVHQPLTCLCSPPTRQGWSLIGVDLGRLEKMLASRAFRGLHLAAGLSAVAVYLAVPDGTVLEAGVEVALHATVAPLILLGVWLHRPSRRAGWYVVAAAQVVYAVGNILGSWVPAVTGAERPFPAPADGFYLAAYVGLVVGISLLLVHRSRGLGLAALLDTATVSVALSSLAWVFLLEPMLPAVTGLAAAVTAAYVLVDVALVAVLVHLALAPGARSPALVLLVAAVAAQVVGDVLYTVGSIDGTFAAGAPAFTAWMLFYVLLGAAPLRPSMRRIAEPDTTVQRLSANGRIILLGAAAMLPPATLLVHVADKRVSVLAAITMLTFACVIARLANVYGELQESTRVQQLKDQLLSIVSHEIRTPLTVVSAALSTLQRGVADPLTSKQGSIVAMASSHTDRLIRLVTDLLDVQRSGSGRVELQLGDVALTDVVRDVFAEIRDSAAARGVQLTCDVGYVAVRADRQRLHQVLMNLVGNGLKFSNQGGDVSVTAVRRGSEVLVRVRDRGRGVPAEMHDKIFEPFQQVDASDSRAHNGTGLGLAICRSIVEHHGGRIWVDSVPGAGATFLFTLPHSESMTGQPEPAFVSADI
ncbi:MAG: HAMP domain-containing histidine kinase [Actinobacteria bacterium]|nr:HAMP domain-containing histidine kinase [Actinomycetota bacterium]